MADRQSYELDTDISELFCFVIFECKYMEYF